MNPTISGRLPGRASDRNFYDRAFELVESISEELGIDLERYRVDRHHWLRFNELRDQGKDFGDIRNLTEIHEMAANYVLENFRVCVLKYDHDMQKVRECMEGK